MRQLLRQLRIQTFEESTIGDLETAVATWLAAQAEATLVDFTFRTDGTDFWAVILYIKG